MAVEGWKHYVSINFIPLIKWLKSNLYIQAEKPHGIAEKGKMIFKTREKLEKGKADDKGRGLGREEF